MIRDRALVLDANILIRAVFGTRVLSIIERFEERCAFYAPDVCIDDARKYIPQLCKKRGLDAALPLLVLSHVENLVPCADRSLYRDRESEARERIKRRDPNDWPIVAAALLLDCAIWTEDQDFFRQWRGNVDYEHGRTLSAFRRNVPLM